MSIFGWGILIFALLLTGALIYWLLIITEGTYLGQGVVTWLYDVVASRYDNIKGFDAEVESAFIGKPLANALAGHRGALVLDIGTGTGRLPLTLLEQQDFRGRLICLDDSAKMLRIAATKVMEHSHRVMLIHRSAARLPFVDSSFDAVTCLEMLEFSPKPFAVVAEAVRVLKPGGILLTTRRTGSDARLMPGKTHTADAFRQALLDLGMESVSMQRWQVDYDLVWARRIGKSQPGATHPLEIIQCSRCNEIALEALPDQLACARCGALYRCIDGMIQMRN